MASTRRKLMKIARHKPIRDENGQALILVMVLLLVGGLIITPLLGFMSTGLIAGQTFETKMDRLYAADAGIEDALWQIKNDQLTTLFPAYNIYNFTDNWTYALSEQINDKDVNVTIQNLWIPKDITTPTITEAENIILPGKLIVTGSVPAGSTNYQIRITFNPATGEEDDLNIQTLGIWLPPGFSYVAGSSNLEADPGDPYYSVPITSPHAGGQAVVWTFNLVPFEVFPGVAPGSSPLTSAITFQFTGQPGRSPEALAWITTSGVADVPFSWDADIKVYKVTSTGGGADGTTIEAYAIKSEMRELGSAFAGDYRAIGNTLMIDVDFHSPPRREELLHESSATVIDIPDDAEVVAAYLYWSGWLVGSGAGQIIWEDNCSNFNNWNNGVDWDISSGEFRARHHGGSDDDRYLEMSSNLDLSPYAGQTVTLTFNQDESGSLEGSGQWVDILYFELSADGNWPGGGLIEAFRDDNPPSSFSYNIPQSYLTPYFKMRFYIGDHPYGWIGPGEYAFIDNIAIAVQTGTIADTTAIFKINGQQVYFDGNGHPQMGVQEIIASEWSVLENQPGEYSYSSFLDVTKLVRAFAAEGPYGNRPGNAIYTVGSVDATYDAHHEWAYAGWALIIIYSSPETRGHQLYLFDDFVYSDMNRNVDFDGDGQPGGTISGFLVPEPIAGEVNAGRLTAFVGEGDDFYGGDFIALNAPDNDPPTGIPDAYKLWDRTEAESLNDVWNSQSLGAGADGVDIDTFHITWASGLLWPGDTSAQIDMYTAIDSWNLVFIILSFRSEVTTGGTVVYLIRG